MRKPTGWPHIALSEATRSWYVTPSGEILPINDDQHIQDFTAFVLSALATVEKPGELFTEYVFLDFSDLLARWYMIDYLLAFKAVCCVYPTMRDAWNAVTDQCVHEARIQALA